jgi:hypothetical protein
VVGRLRFVPANARLTMGIDELLPLGGNSRRPAAKRPRC